MTTNPGREPEIRASDAEREQIARRLQSAAGDGRLTLEEMEERLDRVFSAKYRHELDVMVRDLPAGPTPTAADAANAGAPGAPPARRFSGPLGIHLAVVAVLSVMLIVRWAASESPFFWPVFPMFWLWMSVVVHALVRHRPQRRRAVSAGLG